MPPERPKPVPPTVEPDEAPSYRAVHVKRAPPLPGQPGSNRAADLSGLGVMPLERLVQRLRHYGMEVHAGMDRTRMLVHFMRFGDKAGISIQGEGQLEILPDGYGFLRSWRNSFLPSPDDVYVSPDHVRAMHMRPGMIVSGLLRRGHRKDKYFALDTVETINGFPAEQAQHWQAFEDLTPIFPDRRILLETSSSRSESARVVDLMAPIGFGQRGLIVSPPRSGKTMLLTDLANAIKENYPDVRLLVFLVDERPEEVTSMQRNVDGEVIFSTFDQPATRHVQVADRVTERARSLVESGHDVVLMLDSITRLGRAYNNVARGSGRIMSGGLESKALQRPKRLFGSARNIEGGGSLTILATALVETNSRMDEVIFEEFKGTGNLEIVLNRSISEQRIFPALDVNRSGTRMEDLLFDPHEAELVSRLRAELTGLTPVDAMEQLLKLMRKSGSNAEMLLGIAQRAAP